MGILQDLAKGNFSGAWEDVVKSFEKLPTAVQSFLTKVESDEWTLVQSLGTTALKDIEAGGFSIVSITTAAASMFAQLTTQGVKILETDVVAYLSLLVSEVLDNQAAAATNVPQS